ncbi:MAG: response regulator [Hyphomicrobiales bacterium]
MTEEVLKRILIVEDDESIAEIVELTLEDLGGFEVFHCSSGDYALDMLRKHRPQLVLLDVMMPRMDGPETLRQMRLCPEFDDIPVIFVTARAQVHEQAQYASIGAAGIIVKPFDPITLCDDITLMWKKAKTEDLKLAV